MLPALAAVPVAIVSWAAILRSWRWGVPVLIAATPFSGLVIHVFHPATLPILYRDLLIVLPMYLAFACQGGLARAAPWRSAIPASVQICAAALFIIVTAGMLNPLAGPERAVLIGAKVWLFYLPLLVIGYSWPQERQDLVRLLRLFVVTALVPALLGIALWLSSTSFGYHRTMNFFYGPAAEEATQDFTWFYMGGFFYRIPSTFQYTAQYYGFTLFALVGIYMAIRLDPSTLWRRVARGAMGVLIVACFLSGSRGAFLFTPMLLVLMPLFGARYASVLRWLALIVAMLFVVYAFAGLDPIEMVGELRNLIVLHGTTTAWGGLIDAWQRTGWFGLGTGMNTGAARHAVAGYIPDHIENWYAKALVEFGPLGLAVLVALMAALLFGGWRASARTQDEALRYAGAAIVAFIAVMALHNLKGWQLDLDPINAYFWLFAGFLFRLPEFARPSRSVGSG